MLTGYNTNIAYKNKVYHIQTEDSGQNNPVIVSLLYFQGAILASKKTSYAHLLNDTNFRTKVREMMKEQHKTMIKELLEGKHTPDLKEKTLEEQQTEQSLKQPVKKTDEQAIQKPQSLDEILLNYIMKREK
ncbi:MAG: hypothetical protein HXY53_04130 [Nitrospirae bacterium]|nr:hypothetical protein [Nitrospirota bacterium]